MEHEPPATEEVRAAAERFGEDYRALREEIGRVIVGHEGVVRAVLTGVLVGGHVLLEGVPGIGKTLLVRTLARAVSLSYGRVQFTPDLMPADIIGTTVVREVEGDGGERRRVFEFQRGPVFHQVLLADEINRATPKTQSALLEAMQEGTVTVGGTTHRLPEPFLVLATQNPIEQEGTYPLPEAQQDRFLLKVLVGTPTREELGEILERTTSGGSVEVRAVLDAERLLAHQRLVRRVAMAGHVRDYAVRLVLATHPGSEWSTPTVRRVVRYGASPRAAQALVLGAKCAALAEGRYWAGIEDVRGVAMEALRHRIVLNFEGEAEGTTTDAVVSHLVETVPAGVEGSGG